MWQANKWGIIALVLGLAIVLGISFYVEKDAPMLAEQVRAVGICAVLFLVSMATWLSVRRDLKRHQQYQENMEDEQDEE